MNPGFYKLDHGLLLYGPNFVENKYYQLYAHSHEQHQYPVDGWYWFDSEEEARIHFNLPLNNSEDTNAGNI